ncbi:MAG: DnaB helicase C-terminal domain-containing protein [Candidatus Gracilibacteria bacterium]|nr:DnaB helicase C-terminal domain-containing protein [Candidatus Gracilibacteria bacterium]
MVYDFKQAIEDKFEEIAEKNEHPEILDNLYIKTNYDFLDTHLGLIKGGDFGIIVGRPGEGKTSIALNIMMNNTKNKKKVLYVSLSEKRDTIINKLISSITGIRYLNIDSGNMSDDGFARVGYAIEELSKMNIFIEEGKEINGSLNKLIEKIKELVSKESIDLVIVDYIQLLYNDEKENRVQEMSNKSRKLKYLALELDIPIIVVSQMTRNIENRLNREPKLYDLRDSGSLEEDADFVIALSSIEQKEERFEDSNRSLLNIHILKNRRGPILKKEFIFEKEFFKIIKNDDYF